METKTKRITYGKDNAGHFEASVPIKCPHCGFFMDPIQQSISSVAYNGGTLFTVVFSSSCCHKSFFANYLVLKSSANLINMHPTEMPFVFPEAIRKISPRFVYLYNQAYSAEQLNHFELAGAGYRNAMEVLIKDFAITVLNEPESEVAKTRLFDSISKYLKEFNSSSVAANVSRLLGNDYTHYERRYSHVDFDTLKRYLHVFIDSIENAYLIQNPVTEASH
jgi:hypothetical protein